MKVIALYLPQFHQIKENDEWWGEGYTEWTAVKKGEILIEGQYQPREPYEDNYYDLTNIDIMKWQVELAKEHGLYGFCFYHYWFNGHLLLEKPLEQFLEHSEIDFPFYFCWANERWTRVWEGEANPELLIEQEYDDRKDVDDHFYYWLKFFKDKRYMKEKNKPILSIYNPIAIPPKHLKYMINRWNELARKEGFDGISFIYLCAESMCYMGEEHKRYFDYGVEYEPSYVQHLEDNANEGRKRYYKGYRIHSLTKRFPLLKTLNTLIRKKTIIHKEIESIKTLRDYDEDWKKILSIKHDDYSKYIPGGFVDWDNTPRRGREGKLIVGATPEKFEDYFEQLVVRAKNVYKTDSIVLFAWNEWSEGGYLEPDKKYGDAYLNAIKRVLNKYKEQ
ncbi:glycoside hydrolase family 99-like domain-containing protein [Robinsoniella peoriensis]|uniref:glycosyltransferase WbsX family protein n=1 Tax=Robinsoniella peoriensis TaxID=180332 RepID=UPI00085BB97F|nr:glycoside hydrolase family 99-like domain-containing protein [Robinsoniella peoriensis]